MEIALRCVIFGAGLGVRTKILTSFVTGGADGLEVDAAASQSDVKIVQPECPTVLHQQPHETAWRRVSLDQEVDGILPVQDVADLKTVDRDDPVTRFESSPSSGRVREHLRQQVSGRRVMTKNSQVPTAKMIAIRMLRLYKRIASTTNLRLHFRLLARRWINRPVGLSDQARLSAKHERGQNHQSACSKPAS